LSGRQAGKLCSVKPILVIWKKWVQILQLALGI